MKIKYKNTLEDLCEFNKFYNRIKNNKINVAQIILYIYPIICIYILIKFIYDNYGKTREIMVVSVIVFLVTVVWTKFMSKSGRNISNSMIKTQLKNEIKNNPDIVSEKKLELEADKLRLTSKSICSEIFLEDISEVVENDGNIYIFINNYSIFSIIPILAFINNEQKNIFIKKITDNMKKKIEP